MRKITAAVAALLLALVAYGCSSSASSEPAGSGSVEVDAGAETTETPASKESKPAANTVGPFKLLGKVKPRRDGLGDFTARFRVENVSETENLALFTVTVLKGERIMATLDCSGGSGGVIAPGKVTTVECFSTDKFRRGWSSVELEHAGF